MIRILIAFALGLMMLASTAVAQELSAADRVALQSRIDAFEASFQANDLDAVVDVVSPKVLTAMAEQFGMEPAQLRAGIAQAMEQSMASVTVNSYEMRTDEATQAVTSAGRPYLLVPTTTVLTVDGSTMQADNQTLAFADESTWYLVRIDDAQQVRFLTLAYPEFEGIDFPEGSITVVED